MRKPTVTIADPRTHPHVPGTITVHVLHECGSSLTGSVPLEDIDAVIKIGTDTSDSLDIREFRQELRGYIHEMMINDRHLSDEGTINDIATVILSATIILAVTSEQGEEIKKRLKKDCRIALMIREYTVDGGPAINGRTVVCAPEATLDEILRNMGMGPPSDKMTKDRLGKSLTAFYVRRK